jgi:hypothetical protein
MEHIDHKDINMLKRYSHTQKEAKKAAIAKLENCLRNLDIDAPSRLDKPRASNIVD